jgi:hypothetical protein
MGMQTHTFALWRDIFLIRKHRRIRKRTLQGESYSRPDVNLQKTRTTDRLLGWPHRWDRTFRPRRELPQIRAVRLRAGLVETAGLCPGPHGLIIEMAVRGGDYPLDFIPFERLGHYVVPAYIQHFRP